MTTFLSSNIYVMALQAVEPRPYQNPILAKFLVSSSQFLNSSIVPFYLMKKNSLVDESGGYQAQALLELFVESSTTQFTSKLEFPVHCRSQNIFKFLSEMMKRYPFYFPTTLQILVVPADGIFLQQEKANEDVENTSEVAVTPFNFTELRSFTCHRRRYDYVFQRQPDLATEMAKYFAHFLSASSKLRRFDVTDCHFLQDAHFKIETFGHLKNVEVLILAGTQIEGKVFEDGVFDGMFSGALKELDLSECDRLKNLEGLELAAGNLRVLKLDKSTARVHPETFQTTFYNYSNASNTNSTNPQDRDKSEAENALRRSKFFKPLSLLRSIQFLDMSSCRALTFDRFKDVLANSEIAKTVRELRLSEHVYQRNEFENVLQILGEHFPCLETLHLQIKPDFCKTEEKQQSVCDKFKKSFESKNSKLSILYTGLEGFSAVQFHKKLRGECSFLSEVYS